MGVTKTSILGNVEGLDPSLFEQLWKAEEFSDVGYF